MRPLCLAAHADPQTGVDRGMPDGPRYAEGFYAWPQHQAKVQREMPVTDNRIDRAHIAEQNLQKPYDQAWRRVACTRQRHGEDVAAGPLPQLRPYWLGEICREDWYPEHSGATR